jgi:inner membrane transporter RhtA
MTDRTTADAGHQEHETRASGRPEAPGPESHGVTGRGRLARSQLALPAAMVLSGIVSVQAGAGIADKLFGQIPPGAVTGLRLWTSAVAMAVISGRGLTRALRDLVKRRAWADGWIAVSFGISLLIMNFSIYQSFARIPLGVAVTIEFLGPLAVAVAGSRHLRDVGWVVLAGAGVVLLTQGGHGHLDLVGVLYAGVAGACWAAYIMLSSATGRRFPGSAGLAIAMVVAAILITPPAVVAGGSAMFRPAVLATGAAIGILSSVIPTGWNSRRCGGCRRGCSACG